MKYEDHHNIQLTDEAISAAAELSDRYITGRFLPDKATMMMKGHERYRLHDLPARCQRH